MANVLFFLLTGLAFVLSGCEQKPALITLEGSTMGTYYVVKFLPDGKDFDEQKVQGEINRRLKTVNDQMSTYQDDSELSQFNQHQEDIPFKVSQDTFKVVQEAVRIHQLTEGALDVSIGPLVNLWGFGPEGRPDKVPTELEIASRKKMTGMQHLTFEENQLSKAIPSLYIDLSAIAKGFGVDVIAHYLSELGLKNYLVEIGGELQLKGVNAKGQPWRIAIEKPSDSPTKQAQEIIAPQNMAIATSGDYRNYFEENGVRYSHTIDPKTAKPIHHRLVSVTVIDPSCMTADGLSTAFMVMGTESAYALAEKENPSVFY